MGIMRDAKQAVQQKSSVNGIKGPCWFAALQNYDIVLGTAVDYMHCALEGVMSFFWSCGLPQRKAKSLSTFQIELKK